MNDTILTYINLSDNKSLTCNMIHNILKNMETIEMNYGIIDSNIDKIYLNLSNHHNLDSKSIQKIFDLNIDSIYSDNTTPYIKLFKNLMKHPNATKNIINNLKNAINEMK